jgi:hypothetical protein
VNEEIHSWPPMGSAFVDSNSHGLKIFEKSCITMEPIQTFFLVVNK